MRSDPRVLLADIDQAGSDIGRFIENMDNASYVADVQTQAAVERKFEIIGEALNQLHKTRPDLAERIPQLRQVIDFRNLLIHGYKHVKPDRVWDYAKNGASRFRVESGLGRHGLIFLNCAGSYGSCSQIGPSGMTRNAGPANPQAAF